MSLLFSHHSKVTTVKGGRIIMHDASLEQSVNGCKGQPGCASGSINARFKIYFNAQKFFYLCIRYFLAD